MGTHSKITVKKFESQLQERFDKLLTAIRGNETDSTHYRISESETEKGLYIDPSKVRVAVDDFQTILKEIKRELK